MNRKSDGEDKEMNVEMLCSIWKEWIVFFFLLIVDGGGKVCARMIVVDVLLIFGAEQ